MAISLSACNERPMVIPTTTSEPSNTPTITLTSTENPTQTPFVITTTSNASTSTTADGLLIMSLADNGFFHLFAYSPRTIPFTRLTSDPWDDITPAIGPDGHWLAYSSRRNGYWDLYLLNLTSGNTIRLTDTPEYDASPSWSPDGAYIAYETYAKGNLDIFVKSATDPSQASIPLTQSLSADTSPAWSPNGRQIAFTSNRSGHSQIWVADLDYADSFTNVSNSPNIDATHPAWSPDGNFLAWVGSDSETGLTGIYTWDARIPSTPARWAGSGDWPIWQNNNIVITRQSTPNQTFLTGYDSSGQLYLPTVLLPGPLYGLTLTNAAIAIPGPFSKAAQFTPAPLIETDGEIQPTLSSRRAQLIDLTNVTAPYPQLQAMAVDAYDSLRAQVARDTGWDVLGNLENAYVPLTTPLDPNLGEDWLYTGRAFSINPALIQANWMMVIRTDFGEKTFWRIYLRTTAQDGSQGMPLTETPWDFSARATSSSAYENGGKLMTSIPSGYWFDLTDLAIQYGWIRQPALTNWRTYYAGARLGELVYTQGLDWYTAMLQLYPPDVLVTPTVLIPPTRTPTRTPLWYRSPTPTKTPTPHPTITYQP